MTENKVILAVNNGDGKTRLLTADAGRTVKVKLIPGNKYLLKNVNDDFAPENITLQRVGKALHIIQEGDTQPSIIIENYFDGDSKNPTLMGMAEDGLLYAYIPLSGESYDNGYLMAEGGLAPVALGGEPLGAGGPLLSAPDDENDMLFGMLGWFALAAAGVGAAFALSELDKDESDSQPAPEKPSIGKAVDDEGSIKGPLKSGDVTDDSTPSLIGKGKPGDTIHIIDNDKEIGSVIVDDEGEWSYTPDKPLGDGEHDLSVVVEDPDGNMSPPSDPITIVVDTVAPDAPTIEHIMDKVGKVTGEILEDAYTDDPKPEMSGTGEAGATITIYDNGKKIGETSVNDDGRWYFKPSENLTDGNHSITVSQTDKAGNVSEPSDERDFIVLTEPPGKAETPSVIDDNGPVTGPLKPGDVTDDTKPSFSGEGTPGNTIVIKDNDKEIGSVIVDDEGKWTYTPEKDLSEGEHNVEVIEEDPLGNVGQPSDPIQIIVDTTPPARPDRVDAEDNTGPITGQLKGGDVTDETRPVFSGKGEPGDTVTIYDGDEVLGSTVIDDEGNWSLKPEKPLGEGDHSITVTQTDKAGNTSDPSEALEFEVDTTAPDASADVLKITAVADDVGDRQGNVASGEITDDSKPLISGIGEAGNTVYVYTTDASGKHLIGSAVVGSDGTWSLTPETPLTEGLNQLTLETQDPAGNRVAGDAPSYDINLLIPISTQPSINSVVDNSEPHVGPLQKGDATNDTTPTLSGSAAPGDIVSILDNGKVIGSVTADSNGKWTFTPDAALADGKHTFTVTATDAAGNSRTSGSFPIVIDTAAPSPAENIVINDNVGDKQGPVGSGDTTDDQSPTLSGEAEPGSVVDIYDNDEKIGSVIVDDEGKWSYTPDKPLDKGDHEITTTVTDPSGNTSEPSPGISFTVDPDPNQVTVGEVVDDQGPIVGNLKPGTVTDDVRPELSGKGKPGSTVTIKDGDDVLGSTVVDPDGNWTFTPEQDLADGNHSLTVVSKDPAGNEVTSPSFDITVDATAPEKPVLGSATDDVGTIRGDLSNGSTTDDANPTFNGSAEPGSRVDIYDNGEHIGSTIADDKGAWQFTPTTPLPEGEHHITTTATDEAGNTGPESDDFVLVTDYTPPVATGDVLNITSVMDDVGGRQGNVASGEITDDSKPVINGIGEAGSTVFVYSTDANGKHLLGSAVVNSEGTWTLALDTPLVEGLNQLTLETQDAVGNRVAGEAPSYDITVLIPVSTEPSINSVVDNAEPHVGPMQKGETTNDTTPTLSGSAAPGDVVSILDNGKVIGTAKADSSGKWSFTPDTALADGQHTFTVTATDAAGNARTSGTFPIVIDTAAPSPAENIVINDNVGDKQGPVGDGDTTDDQSPTLSGEAEPGSVVDIYDNDEKIGSVIVDDEGKWSYTPDKPLAKGDHEITTTVTDPSGNTSEPSPGISFTVDPDPNQVTVGEVVDDQGPIVGNLRPGNVTDDARPELGGKGKPGSTVTIMDGDDVLGSTVVDPDGNWTFTPEQDLADGDHSLTVISKDPAGNDVTSPSFDISVDTVAPEKPVVGLATDDVGSSRGDLSSGSTTDDANPTFKGSAEPGSRVDIYDNGELIGSTVVDENGGWQFTPTTALPEGEHHITTTATDKAGNTGPESDDFVLITDYTAPDASKVAITEVYDDVNTAGVIASGEETDDNRPLIKGTGAEPGNTITVYNGDKVIGTAKVQADGTWSLEPTTPLPDGRYTLTAKETDGVGNVSGPSGEYIINVATVPPQAPTLDTVYDDVAPHADYLQKGDVTNDTTPTLSGSSGVAGGTISIYDNGRLIGTTTVGSNGSWSFTPDTALADGSHSFTATVTDGVGRTSEPTGGFGIVIDTKAPDAASDLLVTDNVGAYQGPVVSGDTTDDNTPTLSGRAEPGSTVNIIDNGQVIGSTKVNPDGTWSFTPDQALSNGEHDLTTTVTDPSGNTGPEGSHVVITVDVVPGKVEITAVTDDAGSVTGSLSQNAVTDDTRPQISGTAKAGSTVTIMDGSNVLGTTTAGADGTWSFTPSVDLGRGDHTFTATAKDPMGNESASSSWTVTIDTDAPVKPTIDAALDDVGSVQGNLANGGTTDDPTPTLSGKAEAGSTVKIYDQNGLLGEVTAKADGTWSFSPVAKLPEGEHRFHVTATDRAGNTSADSDDFVLTLDYTAPDASKLAITEVYDDVKTAGVVASGGETDDNRPLIKGTGAEPGNTITVYNGDKVIGTATVQADGTWSLEPTTPLPDGRYTLTAKETDGVGNVSGPSGEYIINVATVPPQAPTLDTVYDDVAPHADYLQKGDVTNDTTPTLSGSSGVAGGTISIYDNGRLIGTATVGSNGSWSFTPDTALADGSHSFTATVTDGVGRTSEPTGGFGIVIDTKAPDAASDLLVTDNVGAYQGPVVSGDTTDDNTPTLSGRAEPGSTVNIIDNGQVIGSTKVNPDGTWSYTPDQPLANGAHDLTTTVTDPSGNTGPEGSHVVITVDVVPGKVEITGVTDDAGSVTGSLSRNAVTDDTRPQISGTAKAGSTVTIMDGSNVLGTTTAGADGTWSFTPSVDLGRGEHTFTATAKDPMGNESASSSWTVTIDTDAPVKPTIDAALDDVGTVQGALSNGSSTDDPTPTLSGKAEAGSTVKIYDQNGLLGEVTAKADGTWSFSPVAKLPEGEHRFHVTATDKAGNTSSASDDFVLTLDYTAPDASKLAITEVYDDVNTAGVIASGEETDDNRPLIKGTGAEAGNTITVYSGDKVIGTATVQADGTWSLEPTTPLPDGRYTLTAKETDGVGNVSGPSGEYIINVATVPPQAPTLDTVYDDVAPHADYLQKGDVTNDTTPTLSGSSGVAGGTISIYDNGRLIGTTTVGSNGSWSFTPDTALADGSHSFTATVTDGVGRTSEPTGGFGIVIDTKAPDAASDLLVTDNVGAYQGPVVSGDTTDDNTPTLSGRAEPGSTVNIIDNGQVIGSTKVNPDGTWSYTPDQPLANGAHDLTTTVTDPSGNTGPEGSHVVITVDVVPGKVEITGVTDDAGSVTGSLSRNAVTDDTRPQISGTAKAGSTVTIMDGSNVLGTTTAGADGTWSFTPSVDLGRGDHTFTATAKDPMGNESSSSSWTVTIDTDAPVKPTIDAALDDVGSVQGNLANGGSTDDPTPTLSGKAEAGSTVKIYDQNGLLGEVTAKADGTWSFSPTAKLPEGEHRFHVTATDRAGNTSAASDDFVLNLDYTAPDASKVSITDVVDDFGSVTGSVTSGGKTDDNTPLIKGTGAEAGNTITVYNGDKVIGTAKVQADGTWELQVTKALPDGTYNLTVKETDSVGNTTAASPEYIIQIDAGGQPLPPTLSSVEDDVAPHTGPLQKDATTNDNTLLLTGTAEANVTVRIYGGPNGTTLLGETKADAQGKWSFNTPKLADGVHTFVAEAINDIGQVSPQTGGFPITVDTSAPGEVTGFIVSDNEGPKTGVLANGDTTDDATPTISGKAEPGSVVHVYVNGQENGTAVADANGNWTYTTGSLADGEYTFTARAEDSAGNLGAENAGVTVTLDTSSVPVTIVRVMDDKGSVTGEMKANDVTDDARPEIIGKAKAGSTVTIMDGNVVLGSVKADASGNWVFTPTSDLGDGVHNITATAKDLTGKEDTSSTFSFEIDSKAPNRPSIDYAEDQVGTVKDDLNSNDVTDDPQPILHGTAEAGSTVNIYTVDGTLLGSVTANSNGAWNFKPGSKLPEGKNTFYVTATDEAGNVSDKSADFILTTDYTAPDASKVTIDSVTDNVGNVQGIVADGGVLDDTRPVIRGSGAEVGNVITVYTTDKDGNTKVLGTTTVDQNGKWELTPSESLYGDSINQLTVTETDRVGNVAKPADSYDVIMSDTPDAPAILNVLDDTGTTVINLANNALTKDDTPTLKGTADGAAGDTITIYNGSQVVGKTTLNSDGTWSFTPSPALADGSYTFTVTNTNSAGQESDRSGSFTVTIDSTAPNPVSGLQVSDDQGAWKGQLTDGMTTDDNKPTFTGKAEQGSTVTIYDNGQAMGTVTVTNPDGSWQFTPSTPLVDGEHQFATQVTDPAGNASAIVDDITVNVSTGASYLQLLQVVDDVQEAGGSRVLRDGEVTNDSQVQLVGKATAGSTIIITDVGGVQLGTVKADANGNWEFTPTSSLSDGAHTLRITGTDPSNNPLTPIDFDLVVDTVAPVAPAITDVLDDVNPVQGSVAHGKPTNDTTPEITGTAEKGSTVNVYHQVDATTRILLGTAVADSTTGQWTLQITDANKLAEGTWNLVATSTDAAGNVSTPSNTWTIVVDTTVSDAVINISSVSEDRGASDTDFITSDNTLLINGELNKALQADEWVEISLDNGVTWTRASTVTGTSWTVDMQSTPLNDGAYTIQARVVDNAGNVGSTDSQALQVASGGSDMNGLSTTTKVTTDTSHGLTTGDHFSHAATATNGDMVTRDRTVTISGNLSAALQAGEHLQISLDNGKTWKTLALNGQSWSYELPEATASTTHSFKLQVIDVAGNPGTNTNFADSYNVVIDLDSPNGITGAPDVPQHTTTGDSFTFSSGQYGRVEAGAIISLVSDVNNNGTYQEGLDQVIGFVKANADGSWSLNTSLPSGAHNLAFVVWDEAGNRSSMSASTSTGVTEGGGSTLIEQTWGGTTDADSRGLNAAAVTISQDGLWSFFQSARGTSGTATANAGRVYDSVTREDYDSTYLAQPSTENGAGYDVDSTSYSRYVNSAAFADINRDGYADVMSQISSYSNAGRTAYWLQNADGSYSAKALDQGTLNHLGGVISYDREGDGYLDFVLGDSEADSISFIKNTQGTLSYEDNSGFSDGHPGGALPTSLSVLHEVGAVDIDNNGTVDITAHIDYNGAGNLVGNNSRGLGILYNQTTGTSKTNFGEVGYYANVFRDDGHEDYGNLSISMTYADYNNDGWLDLFLSRGSKGGSNSDESRIYLNDGTGKLNATDSQAQWFGDNVDGGTSLAVDWNHDGKMDIIEVPRSGVTGSPMLYTNTGSNNWGANKVSLTGSTTFNNMTGAVALDYDWDGSMDLVLYRSGADADVVARDDAGRTMLVKNTNIAADGTSLQIRIVDGNGINTFYSNTVKLYNSAGELVATQLINPQSSGSSNSMGLVSFFGLDPNEVYSVQMLRITDGEADHVGATSSIGGYTNGTVNESWGGLTTGKAHDSYVLTAESGNAANNTSGNSGIVGTGYNDTFFGSAGNDTYNGGGGWNQIVSGKPVWSETAGMDVVDYSRSTTAINANLWTGTATGNGTDKLLNIEGLLGSSQQDTFTDNSANNLFDGRGGNDAFYLVNGGNDTLMYNVLEGMTNDSTGGNGHDTIHGFKVGNLVKDSDADLLDMSELLDYKGSISFFEDDGKLELDYSSRGVLDYVKVEVVGSDTVISIDRDGQGGQHGFTQVVTLADVQTDLVTLLQNNQIMM
ncbi:Ig-like domain-containing protein [Enterobacter cloacae]|uniref:Ig-like domain-containing protein n=6 Tax=Enterobacter cloacae complex TaxID=354276 RepID=UPI00280A90FC|nr:Ig-like domain-containing protein [Enterobacter hormaechei]MDR9915659.1 Ig-like domain-containing protein [Enterobacter hormaechei subsp. xiangfangensis]WMA27129.1 Ig-like domain-containing protein [Enterobacter hormaechei]WMA40372.1 Ig-like domain-containing protein [Enterobacter hormaechei]WMM60641.1 Ig-like domain-containing protein [Enterobacter hormaechei]